MQGDFDLTAVVTNPDRPAGRGYEMQASPIKEAALAHGLPVWQPAKARDPEFQQQLQQAEPDVCVVVAYGKILPGSLLVVPRFGFVNVHFSLLPEYRGAAPVQRAVMDGRDETGVSIMVLTEGMDEGPVLATRAEKIADDDTAGSVGERLAVTGAELLTDTLAAYLAGDLQPKEQDHEKATYAPKLSTEEAQIDWTESAQQIRDKVRGLQPTPGAWTTLDGARLKIHQVVPSQSASLAPGRVRVDAENFLVGTGAGDLVIAEAQMAGKRRMPGIEVARGLRLDGVVSLGG